MLKALFGSETRVKVISAFLLNPEKSYSVRVLARETSIPSATLRKEILSLKNFGLLKLEGKDNWLIDKNFIIFPELRALIAKAQLLSSQKFIEGLSRISQPKLLALTGFFTGDEMVKTDILVVGKIKRRPFLKLLHDLEKDLGQEINYTIIEETEFVYRREVMDIFLYNILHGKTIFLINELDENTNSSKKEESYIAKSDKDENNS
jgi:hypothetical protein